MNPRASRYLFLLGGMLLGLVLFSLYATWIFKHFSPYTDKLSDAGINVPSSGKDSMKTFENGEDYERLQGEKLKHLRSYGWVNKAEGIVHIPIDKAIDDFIKRSNHE